MEKMEEFMEKAAMPAIQQLIKINADLAKRAEGLANFAAAAKKSMEQANMIEAAVGTLTESVAALSTPMAQLVESVNNSNRLQEKQMAQNAALLKLVTEQNARLATLQAVLSVYADDPGLMPPESREE